MQSAPEIGNELYGYEGIIKLRNKPFWIFDKEQHRLKDIRTKGQCCFWHIIKCPQKDGHDMPVLPYQKILYDALQNHKHIWIKKSRGIGCSVASSPLACRNKCQRLYVITQASYSAGGKHCSKCAHYFITPKMICECCRMRLRASPGARASKEKLRAKRREEKRREN